MGTSRHDDRGGDDGGVRVRPGDRSAPGAPDAFGGTSPAGLLMIHGFTGTPASMAPIADAATTAQLRVEQPLLSGHGTDVADLIDVTWNDWVRDVNAARDRLVADVEHFVVCGQSLGGTLALWLAWQAHHDDAARSRVAGVVCINPLTMPRRSNEMELIDELIADGVEVAPGGDSDIADPHATDHGYRGTPLRALRSALVDGVEPLARRYGEITNAMLLFTSRHDHVVEPANSEMLVEHYGGRVDWRWLERSYHVAAIDFDRDVVAGATVEFCTQTQGGSPA